MFCKLRVCMYYIQNLNIFTDNIIFIHLCYLIIQFMKRGKRQIAQRTEPFLNQESDLFPSTQGDNQFSQFYETTTNNQTASHQQQIVTFGARHIVSQQPVKNNIKSAVSVSSVNQAVNSKQKEGQTQIDQKKRKIQLLKQKYLKKSAPQKQPEQIVKKQSQILPPQIIKSQNKPILTNENSQQTNYIKQRQNSQLLQKRTINKNQDIFIRQNDKVAKQNDKPIKQNDKTIHQNTKLVEQKIVQKLQITSNEVKNFNTIVPNATIQKPIGRVPPPPLAKRNTPPPPPISSNKGIGNVLNRKFNKQIIKQEEYSFKVPDPFDSDQNQFKIGANDSKQEQKNLEVDEQYLDPSSLSSDIKQIRPQTLKISKQSKQSPVSNQDNYQIKPKTQEETLFNIEDVLKNWIQNPQLALKTMYPKKKQLIQYYFMHKFIKPELVSKNQNFNKTIKQIVTAFILHNQSPLNQQQKKVVQQIFITFFYSNPKDLDDIFLVGLIKIGQKGILKYKQIIKQNFEFYLGRLILLKNLLLQEQINKFIQLCLSAQFFYEQILLYLMMLSPQDEKLIQKLQNYDFQNEGVMVELLILCRINLKNKIIVGLYLKLLSNLTEVLSRHKFTETTLSHLKQIQIPENLYQLSKQLKLKLLKNYEQKQTKKQANNDKSGNDGLFKYFNKAIDKIKSTTTTTINNTSQKTVKQQEPKDQIIYDPVLKRYVINGVVPVDENQKKKPVSSQQQKKSPPPPPALGKKSQVPPPPSLGKKVNRLVNKYT